MGACLGRNRKENSSSVSHAHSRNPRRSQENETNGSPQFSGRKIFFNMYVFLAENLLKVYLFLKKCLYDLYFLKTRYFHETFRS